MLTYGGREATDFERAAAVDFLAAQAAIYKQTADAQGDFERTSDGLANKQRILKAQLQNAATTIGTALLPIATKLFSFIGDNLVPIVEKLTSTFSEEGLGGAVGEDDPPRIVHGVDDIREMVQHQLEEPSRCGVGRCGGRR